MRLHRLARIVVGTASIVGARAHAQAQAQAQAPLDSTVAWHSLVRGWSLTARGYRLTDTVPAADAAREGAGGSAFVLRSTDEDRTATFGAVFAGAPAAPFRGRRVRVRAELRTRGAAGGGSLWVRADGVKEQLLRLDNGEGRRIRGDSGWVLQELVLDVPPEASRIVFGALLMGSGEIAVRALRVTPAELDLAASANAPIAPEALALFDSAVTIVRRYALVRDTVSWDVALPPLRRRLAGATRREDAYPVVTALARRLGDRHSFFRPPPAAPPVVKSEAAPAPQSIQEKPVATRWLAAERVGYLRVPAHTGMQFQASREFVVNARNAIATMADSGACAWVVDLRGNGGGNMWPMLAALRPLLGEGELGTFRAPTDTTHWGVQVRGSRAPAYDDGLPRADLTAAPVAVLTDDHTASSGEAVATALSGRPSTRSFGAPTAGLSTSNRGFRLPGGGMLLLTVSIYADRTGREFGHAMPPDEPVAETPNGDAPLARALAWLGERPACKR